MKKLLFLATAALALASCGAGTTYKIEGTVADSTLNGKTVFLMDAGLEKNIDSMVVADNKFSFEGQADSAVILRAYFDRRKSVSVVSEPGVIKIDFGQEVKVSGTPLNDEFHGYLAQVKAEGDKIQPKITELSMSGNAGAMDSLFKEYIKTIDNLREPIFAKNLSNKLGVVLAYDAISSNRDINLRQLDSIVGLTQGNAEKFAPITKIRTKLVSKEATAEGKMFTDFGGVNGDGQEVKLSDYVGKGQYALVDFWASWCGPCKAEIPVIKELYERFHEKGLVVVGVNVWDKKEGFDEGVKALEIPWVNICNFGNNIPTDIYGIQGVPHIMLVAPDGTIQKRGLRGDEMVAAIEAIYADAE